MKSTWSINWRIFSVEFGSMTCNNSYNRKFDMMNVTSAFIGTLHFLSRARKSNSDKNSVDLIYRWYLTKETSIKASSNKNL